MNIQLANSVLNSNFATLEELLNSKEWFNIAIDCALSESFIREFADYLDWDTVSGFQSMSTSFIREFADRIDFSIFSEMQKLSEYQIAELADLVDFESLSANSSINESIIREYMDKMDVTCILMVQPISDALRSELESFRSNKKSAELENLRKGVETLNLLERADLIEYIKTLASDVAEDIINGRAWVNVNIDTVCKEALSYEYSLSFRDKKYELMEELYSFYASLGAKADIFVNEAMQAVESKIEDSIMEIIEAIKSANK